MTDCQPTVMPKCHHCKRKPRGQQDLDRFMLFCSTLPSLVGRSIVLCPEHVANYASRQQVAAAESTD